MLEVGAIAVCMYSCMKHGPKPAAVAEPGVGCCRPCCISPANAPDLVLRTFSQPSILGSGVFLGQLWFLAGLTGRVGNPSECAAVMTMRVCYSGCMVFLYSEPVVGVAHQCAVGMGERMGG